LDTRFTPPARSASEGIGLALAASLARRVGVVAVAVEPGATRAFIAAGGPIGRHIGRGSPRNVAIGTMVGVSAGSILGLKLGLSILVIGVCVAGILGAVLGAAIGPLRRRERQPEGWMGAVRQTWDRHHEDNQELIVLTDHALFITNDEYPPWPWLIEQIKNGKEPRAGGKLYGLLIPLDEVRHLEVPKTPSSMASLSIAFAIRPGAHVCRRSLYFADTSSRDAVVAAVLGCFVCPGSREERVLGLRRLAFEPMLMLAGIVWFTATIAAFAAKWRASPPENDVRAGRPPSWTYGGTWRSYVRISIRSPKEEAS